MKLSKAQKDLLTEAAGEQPARAVDSYPPVKKLLALGLIKPFEGKNSYNNRWVITEAGRKVLGA